MRRFKIQSVLCALEERTALWREFNRAAIGFF